MTEQPKITSITKLNWNVVTGEAFTCEQIQTERMLRDGAAEPFGHSFIFDLVRFIAWETRRARFLKFMKHHERKGPNARIAVEQRKAKLRRENRQWRIAENRISSRRIRRHASAD
jgi:hypothetical protein